MYVMFLWLKDGYSFEKIADYKKIRKHTSKLLEHILHSRIMKHIQHHILTAQVHFRLLTCSTTYLPILSPIFVFLSVYVMNLELLPITIIRSISITEAYLLTFQFRNPRDSRLTRCIGLRHLDLHAQPSISNK